jgi:drug/metabolite transporter (DMT)-like permease
VVAVFASSWGISMTAMLLYYYLINTIGASATSTTLYLTPINGVFWGAVILSEPVTWSMITALVLILSGVILVNRAAAKTANLAKSESPVTRGLSR